jgi:hypothetical protein
MNLRGEDGGKWMRDDETEKEDRRHRLIVVRVTRSFAHFGSTGSTHSLGLA